MNPNKFQKKAIIIEAMQLTEESVLNVIKWVYGDNYNIKIDGSGGKIILEGSNNTALYMNRELTSSGSSAMDNISGLNININGNNNNAISYGFASSQSVDLPILNFPKNLHSLIFLPNLCYRPSYPELYFLQLYFLN